MSMFSREIWTPDVISPRSLPPLVLRHENGSSLLTMWRAMSTLGHNSWEGEVSELLPAAIGGGALSELPIHQPFASTSQGPGSPRN